MYLTVQIAALLDDSASIEDAALAVWSGLCAAKMGLRAKGCYRRGADLGERTFQNSSTATE